MKKIALAGLGYWGFNLLRNLVFSGKFEVVGCVDPSADARQKCTKQYPFLRTYESLEQLFKSERPDAAVIATPPNTHKDLAITAIRHGLDVIVEKPLATNVRDCDDILNEAEKQRRLVEVDHTFIYHPAVEFLSELVNTDQLGELLYYDSVRVNFGKFQQANVLWDLAPHDLSILARLTKGAAPVSVAAIAANPMNVGVESICYLTLQYPNGLLAHLNLNWLAPMKIRTIMIGGSKKMAIYDDNLPSEKIKIYDKQIKVFEGQPEDVRVRYRTGDMLAPALPTTEALANMISNFAKCLETREQPASSGHIGREIVRVLEAASLSIQKDGQKIKL